MKLAENIRAHRKARGLTQEQLAEVLGVTVGAVYKWEAKLSTPELPLIVEMADFFDCSVDALLGYEMKDNRPDAAVGRIWQYHANKDREGLKELEKALKKYPNSFALACAGAALCHGIGLEAHDKVLLRQALELYERARQLLPQNRDERISEQTLCGDIAQVYFALGEKEKAVEMAKAQNAGKLYSAMIGTVLAVEMNRPAEALPYLSQGLIKAYSEISNMVSGFAYAFRALGDHENGAAVLRWGIATLRGLKASDRPDFSDKLCAFYVAHLAGFQLALGDEAAARQSLRRARSLARAFDDAPDYSFRNARFITGSERDGASYDTLGMTAAQAVENVLNEIGCEALSAIYRELASE